ncbi:hypothetical protein C3B59_10505 [Cryobacterium zongtaii]|uniref:Uncharacterized protein n=1 Tax=Cryobacterium zongtaii TaxID=1259217 RepID=A0A2S3ZCI4_9MICO|nr:DUF2746 domain-containing protein [Cryobacterium zongtaii]POH63966.1 hypothetical protein C3B59_10505 [Cryobacterium zongtaii]
MSEGVIIALLGTTGVVIAALLSFLAVTLQKTREHARSAAVTSAATAISSAAAATDSAITKEQVQNSHTTNLREESDTRHDAVMTAFASLQGAQAELARAVDDVKASQRGMQRDIGRLGDADLEHFKAAREDRDRISKHIQESTSGEQPA